MLSAFACFTYNEESPPSTGRVPTTLSVVTPLSNSGPTSIVTVWSGVRGATVRIDCGDTDRHHRLKHRPQPECQ